MSHILAAGSHNYVPRPQSAKEKVWLLYTVVKRALGCQNLADSTFSEALC